LLEQKWKLGPTDKDLVVMWHHFRYHVEGQHQSIHASLAVIGKDQTETAMAHSRLAHRHGVQVGAERQLQDRGVMLPLKPVIYDPVLNELETLGITFHEKKWKSEPDQKFSIRSLMSARYSGE
jgi:hypothetical protein